MLVPQISTGSFFGRSICLKMVDSYSPTNCFFFQNLQIYCTLKVAVMMPNLNVATDRVTQTSINNSASMNNKLDVVNPEI